MDDTNQPQAIPPEPPHIQEPATPQRKHQTSRPLLIVLLCVIVAVLAGAAGILGYRQLYTEKPTAVKPVAAAAPVKQPAAADAATLVSGLKPELKSTAVATEVNDGGDNVVVTGTDFGVAGAPLQQPSGSDFFTGPATFSHITVASNGNAISDDVRTAEAYFMGQHMLLDAVNYAGSQSGVSAQFHNATTICALAQTAEPWPQGSNQLTANCADLTSYQAEASALAPVFAVYASAQPDTKVAGVYFQGQMSASATKGYHYASINTGNVFAPAGGSIALLYQTPDGSWHYFKNTQSTLACSEFTAGDITKAFAGLQCATDTSQTSKVGE